jgi:hypothetical protein
MKIVLLFFIISVPLVPGGLSFGPAPGESSWSGPMAKSVFHKTADKLYSEENLRNDLAEIKSMLIN